MGDDPRFPTIREAARRGPLSEHSLRMMQKRGQLPGFFVGNRFLINYPMMLEMLNEMSTQNLKKE